MGKSFKRTRNMFDDDFEYEMNKGHRGSRKNKGDAHEMKKREIQNLRRQAQAERDKAVAELED